MQHTLLMLSVADGSVDRLCILLHNEALIIFKLPDLIQVTTYVIFAVTVAQFTLTYSSSPPLISAQKQFHSQTIR